MGVLIAIGKCYFYIPFQQSRYNIQFHLCVGPHLSGIETFLRCHSALSWLHWLMSCRRVTSVGTMSLQDADNTGTSSLWIFLEPLQKFTKKYYANVKWFEGKSFGRHFGHVFRSRNYDMYE